MNALKDSETPNVDAERDNIKPMSGTPKGEKKIVSGDFPKTAYDPKAVEASWYDWWNTQGFFAPRYKPGTEEVIPSLDGEGTIYTGQIRDEGLFVMPAPPPNITGDLHLGHALTSALQDTLIRWYRIKGYTTLHVPGFDHGGISTQAVVENMLLKTEGKSRHDYGREAFLSMVREWKENYHGRTLAQIERLGASSDWDRVAYTMDPHMSKAVNEAFYMLHTEGRIYRANRLVNWCVKLNTTLSNLEVNQKTLTGRTMLGVPGYEPKELFEFGVIVSLAYKIEDTEERIVVATTRPDTMLGDTAIAVHPDDIRFKHLHGKFAAHPFLDRRLPIICDSTLVDMTLGTGAVKITPAHSHEDYECAKRHGLTFINLLNDDGTFNENAGPFQGMKRFHARSAVVEALKERGLYVDTQEHPMELPVCSKSGDIIEIILKPQWWIDLKDASAEALRQTKTGLLNISPKSSAAEFRNWLSDPQDWCISRQLWWGHRIPAYLLSIDGAEPDHALPGSWVVGRTEEEAMSLANKMADGRPFTLQQDEDVLDTWFSAGLWPFAIMGWPEATADLHKFYPTQMLETGWDILPFWVARMVLLGITLTGQMPFKEVLCHGLIRDPEGRKMSKSLGNVVDPVDLIEGIELDKLQEKLKMGNLPEQEVKRALQGQRKLFPKGIPQCGTDALRFGLCNSMTGGGDKLLNISDIHGYRKFCNKIWNATKFCMFKFGMVDIQGRRLAFKFQPNASDAPTRSESLAEKWILHRLNETVADVNKHLTSRSFHDATEKMHAFWLHTFCDCFIEATKALTAEDSPAKVQESVKNTIYTCLDTALRFLHPVMPYITEDLWQRLPRRPGCVLETIMLCPFPEERTDYSDAQAAAGFDLVMECIRTARSLIARYSRSASAASGYEVHIEVSDERTREMIIAQINIMKAMIKGSSGVVIMRNKAPEGWVSENVGSTIVVSIEAGSKVDTLEEEKRLQKQLAVARKNQDKIEKRLCQPGYADAVPAAVKAKDSEQMKIATDTIERLCQALDGLTAKDAN